MLTNMFVLVPITSDRQLIVVNARLFTHGIVTRLGNTKGATQAYEPMEFIKKRIAYL